MEVKDKDGDVVAKVVAHEDKNISGVWVDLVTKDGTKPTLCFYKGKDSPLVLAVYKDQNRVLLGCELAVSFDDDGPTLQVCKGKEVKLVNLFDLIPGKAVEVG